MARHTVIVDERPVLQGLLRLAVARAPAATAGPAAATFDLLASDLDIARTGGRGAVAAPIGRVPTPSPDDRPFTPERIQEAIGPFLK